MTNIIILWSVCLFLLVTTLLSMWVSYDHTQRLKMMLSWLKDQHKTINSLGYSFEEGNVVQTIHIPTTQRVLEAEQNNKTLYYSAIIHILLAILIIPNPVSPGFFNLHTWVFFVISLVYPPLLLNIFGVKRQRQYFRSVYQQVQVLVSTLQAIEQLEKEVDQTNIPDLKELVEIEDEQQ